MLGRVVEIAEDGRHLTISRGFLVIAETSGERKELGQVPLDDVGALIGNAHGLSYTNNVLVSLAERGAPFVLCGRNHNVVGMLLPGEGHLLQARRFDAQIGAGRPLKKRLWAEIVKCKLRQQAAALEAAGAPVVPISSLIPKVRSGDPGNIEAQAARRYWSLLFGEDFRRDRSDEGINALLNYGYTVLRAASTRAVVAAGLHPTLGMHHANEGNAMRLVDDLMEAFRPVIDLRAWLLHRRGERNVTPDTKRALVRTLYDDLPTSAGMTPLSVAVQKLAVSLAQVYEGERESLDLPLDGLPLSLISAVEE